jgi:hypothetical protein
MKIITLALLLLFFYANANAGIYWLADDAGNVSRHEGDTPYPDGAVIKSTVPRDTPVDQLRIVGDTVMRKPVSEMPVTVPEEVSRFRFWLAWYGATQMTHEDVRAAIASWPDGADKAEALIAIDNAQVFKRANPFIEMLRQQAGLTEEQMDGVFIAASQLEVD